MKRFLKVLLVIGTVLVLLGGAIFSVGFAASGWDLSVLSNTVLEDRTFLESEGDWINNLTFDVSDFDVTLIFCEDAESLRVDYHQPLDKYGNEKSKITLTADGGSLTFLEKTIWYRNLFSIGLQQQKITVTLPANRNYELIVKTGNGDITLQGKATCGSVQLKSGNGNIDTLAAELRWADSLRLSTGNGDIRLGKFDTNVLHAQSGNGRIELSNGTARTSAECHSGNGKILVSGTLTGKVVKLESGNGRILVGGRIVASQISIKSGNGKIGIEGLLDAADVVLHSGNGDITAKLMGQRAEYRIAIDQGNGSCNVSEQTDGIRTLTLKSSNGDIHVTFSQPEMVR